MLTRLPGHMQVKDRLAKEELAKEKAMMNMLKIKAELTEATMRSGMVRGKHGFFSKSGCCSK